MIQEPCWPLRFSHQQLPVGYFADPTLAEQPLFARARDGEAVAQLWQARRGLWCREATGNLPNSRR